jgi:hypothetical protein
MPLPGVLGGGRLLEVGHDTFEQKLLSNFEGESIQADRLKDLEQVPEEESVEMLGSVAQEGGHCLLGAGDAPL